jgi:hypothetical protein
MLVTDRFNGTAEHAQMQRSDDPVQVAPHHHSR